MKRIIALFLSTICILYAFAKTPILGNMVITDPNVLYSFVKTTSPNTTCELEIAKQFIEVGRKYGVRGDIAFCQSIIETGWFKFEGSAVTSDQHNYCGLGVTSNGMKGESFNTIEDGVTAQIQHLYAYCCKKSLPYGETIIDPRFKYVTRGVAPNWEDLDGRWATGGGYSSKILNMYSQLQNYTSLNFTEYWNLSEQKGNKTSKGYDASKIRNMAYANGKLYAVYDHSKIIVIKAQTGEKIGELNDFNIDGVGILKYCDVQTVGNKIVVCNLCDNKKSNDPFRIYVWDDDTKLPRILLETHDFGGVNRIGDCFNIWRDLNNGTIYLGHDDGSNTCIFEYRITNGVCGTSPNIIKATTNGNHMEIGTSCRVIPQSTGYWINGKNSDLIRTGNDGSETYRVPYDVKWGNAFTAFEYRGKSYGAITTFNKPDGVAAHNYTGGRFALLDPYNGWANSTVIGEFPKAGLGNSSQNTYCTGNVIANVCNGGKGLEMWVLSTTQGMAYLYTGSCPWDQNVNPIPVIAPAVNANVANLDFSTSLGNKIAKTITVSGKDLQGNISLSIQGADAGSFSLSASSVNPNDIPKNITVTYNPTSAGNHSASLKIESPYAETLNIPLSGTAINVKLQASDDVLYFNSQVNVPLEKEITITGENLVGDINLSVTGSESNRILFSLSDIKINKTETSKTITVTYTPTFEGFHYATLEVKTTGTSLSIPLNGEANSDPQPASYFSTNWCFSTVMGNSTDWIDPANDETRNMAMKGNNLYVLRKTNQIFIVDAYTGTSKGTLKTEGVTTSWFGLSSIANMGGSIIACDLALDGTGELHVYAWDNDNANPRLILSTTDHGNIRMGDLMGTSGNINNGKLWFGGKDGKVYVYTISGGKASTVPTVITLKDKKDNVINTSNNVSVMGFHVNSDGTFWATGSNGVPMLFNSDGTLINELMLRAVSDNLAGTSFFPFEIGDRKYALANVYSNLPDGKSTATEGRLNFIDIRYGEELAYKIYSFPNLGIPGVYNSTLVTSAFAVVDKANNIAHAWTLVPQQGAAKYTIKGIVTDVEENFAEKAEISVANGAVSINSENAVIELISINGMRVAFSENSMLDINDIQKGIYIIVATLENGERITKKIAIF